KRVLAAGPGFGGSCFPRDTVALIKTAHDHGAQLRRLEAVVRSLRAPPPRLARERSIPVPLQAQLKPGRRICGFLAPPPSGTTVVILQRANASDWGNDRRSGAATAASQRLF